MLDEHGYPLEESLDALKDFDPIKQTKADFLKLLSETWKWWKPECVDGDRLRLATGGWSGNEETMTALRKNFLFHGLCWQSSHRGGLHIYDLSSWRQLEEGDDDD